MHGVITDLWSNHNLEISFSLAVSIGASVLIWAYREDLTPSDFIEILAILALVIVTAWYAVSTHRIQKAVREQTNVSQAAVRTALRAERNTVMPIVILRDHSRAGEKSVRVDYKNVGKGPVLEFRLWAQYSLDGDVVRSEPFPLSVLEVDDPYNYSRVLDFSDSIASGARVQIIAIYKDIYRQEFCSSSTERPPDQPEFLFRPLNDEGSLMGPEGV